MNLNNFTGYVLAGGKSSRMKTDKAFLRFGDETFLERAVKTISHVCENRVVIVLNQAQTHFIEKLPAGVPYIFDVFENRGALAGMHAALQNCRTEYAVILAIDLPYITNEAIEILAKITSESKNEAAIVPLQSDDRIQPLCAVYRTKDCLPELENLLKTTASASVRNFLRLVSTHFVEQNTLAKNANENLFFNVNHPSDFQILNSQTP